MRTVTAAEPAIAAHVTVTLVGWGVCFHFVAIHDSCLLTPNILPILLIVLFYPPGYDPLTFCKCPSSCSSIDSSECSGHGSCNCGVYMGWHAESCVHRVVRFGQIQPCFFFSLLYVHIICIYIWSACVQIFFLTVLVRCWIC